MIGTSFDGGTTIRKRHFDLAIHEAPTPPAGFSWSTSPYADRSHPAAWRVPAAVELKRVDAPRLTPAIRFAVTDLGLAAVAVLYPGTRRYALAERVEAVPLHTLAGPGRLFEGMSS